MPEGVAVGSAGESGASGDLAREIDQAVRAVAGVLQSYDTHSSVVAVASGTVAAVTGRTAPVPVTVRRAGTGIEVLVRIAVSHARPAAETCREVYAVVAALAESRVPADVSVSVSVEVSRIG